MVMSSAGLFIGVDIPLSLLVRQLLYLWHAGFDKDLLEFD